MTTPAAAFAALLLLPFAPPAAATTLPAYGTIVIRDDGLGYRVTWTYAEPLWRCRYANDGTQETPYGITVTCTALRFETLDHACPLMVVTARTALKGRAAGHARCTRAVDTRMAHGDDLAMASADLGPAPSVVCRAYGDNLPLVPPYEVTCGEPGLPAG
jgi:hypothetical protein